MSCRDSSTDDPMGQRNGHRGLRLTGAAHGRIYHKYAHAAIRCRVDIAHRLLLMRRQEAVLIPRSVGQTDWTEPPKSSPGA